MNILVNKVGMSPMQVIKAATLINAEMIGMDKKIGSIEIGKQADIVVLNKNPLVDIKHIGMVQYVFKRGERVK